MASPRHRPCVLAETDVLLAAFGRAQPDPQAAATLIDLVDDRRLLLVGWVRQSLLARCATVEQFHRLARALQPVPELRISTDAHLRAALKAHELRTLGANAQPAQLLMWAMADSVEAVIWTRQSRWQALAPYGCPLL